MAVARATVVDGSVYATGAPYPGDQYIAVTGTDFALDQTSSDWALTASGCVLTYGGAPAVALVTLNQTLNPDAASADRRMYSAAAYNGDILGEAAFTTMIAGMMGQEANSLLFESLFTSQRFLSALSPGDTLQPTLNKLVTDSAAMTLRNLTLSVFYLPTS